MLLHWSDIYKTGHPEIDEQHEKIIDAMNELHVAVMERKDKDALVKTVKFLNSYTKDHFSFEERCVEEFKCPNAGKNKKAHADFLKLLDEKQALMSAEEVSHPEVLDFYYEIVFWIKDHILEIDKDNFACARDQIRAKFGKTNG